MGKVCSKEGDHARSPRHRPIELHTGSVRLLDTGHEKSDVSRQMSAQPDTSFNAPEVRPPHSVLKESIQDLSRTHRFYVHLHGLKARNLNIRSSDSLLFCVVNWDDFAFEKRTRKIAASPNPRWGDAMQFYYSVPTLAHLRNKSVVIHLYEESGSKSRAVGATTVDLMTVASGPIHHDLTLHEFSGKTLHRSSDVGRLIFDLRMAQVCQLIISPIEVLVHIHESLDALDQLEVEGVGTRRAGNPLATEAMTRTTSMKPPTSAEPSSVPLSATTRGNTVKTSKSMAVLYGQKHDVSTDEEAQRRYSSISEAADAEETEDTVLSELATAGHSESDAIAPVLAEWQLTFIPTGVDNPVEFCSAFTAICDQPYWNSVDHTLINELLAAEPTATTTDGDTLKSQGQVTASPFDQQALSPTPSRATEYRDLSQLPPPVANGSEESKEPSVVIPKPHGSSSPIKSQLRHVPISLTKHKGSKQEKNLSALQADSTTATATPSRSEGPVPPAVLVHSMSAAHINHIDPQATYRQLAAVCRRGRLVRELLYDDLPTIQLETTSDFLRQNHLKLRLYARRLGLQAPKFYGEAWLPFFKIYDVDVVEQMHQNFSDAYFHEKLWYEGKCIGHIEGVIVFQNNPMIRQMLAGVNTGSGFTRISPPILGTMSWQRRNDDQSGSESKSAKLVLRSQHVVPEEVSKISQLHQSLLDILFSKTQHRASEAGLLALAQVPASTKGRFPFLSGHRKGSKGTAAEILTKREVAPGSPGSRVKSVDMIQGAQQEFHNVCDQVLQVLRVSHVETRRSFLYQSGHALLIGQRVFLNLAEHVLEFADDVPWQYRSTYSAILHQTLRRGELDIGSCLPEPPTEISHLSFEERSLLHAALKQRHHVRSSTSLLSDDRAVGGTVRPGPCPASTTKSTTSSGISNEPFTVIPLGVESLASRMSQETVEGVILYHKRMKLCRHYFLVLNRVLNYCLTKLSGDCVFEGQRKYISIFLCICYFRLPSFRRELLDAILTPEERSLEISEWRGTEYELDRETLAELESWQSGFEHRLHLDWSPLHDSLKGYFGEDVLSEALTTLSPPREALGSVLCRRSTPTVQAKHVYQAIPQKKCLQWHLLPGYATLLKGLLVEMKRREVTRYPDALLNCSGAMLANERLLSVFIKIIFFKTCVFNSSAVFATLNYVDYWIQVLTLRDQLLPPNFDLQFLRRGLDIVLGSDIGLCTAKGIWFIYKNLPIFKHGQLRVLVIDLLFEKYFFTLFLNWSWLVRRCFMWLLLYRVCEPTRLILTREAGTSGDATPSSLDVSAAALRKVSSGSQNAGLTPEEQTIVLGYLEFNRYLTLLNAPPVFPKDVTRRRLTSFLLDDCSIDSRGKDRTKSDLPVQDSAHHFGMDVIKTRAHARSVDDTPATDSGLTSSAGGSAHARSPLGLTDIIGRMKRLCEDPSSDTAAALLEEQQSLIPEHARVYIKSAVPEFMTELQVYRSWVAAGAEPIPAMNIPASPLDSNVDVPIDNW